jgi:hypothetical protein
MTALRLPKVPALWCGILVVLGLGLISEAPAAPDPNTLLTNPLNRHNMAARASGGHGGIKAALSGGTDQICIFCHTPHSAEPVDGPLWNRIDPAGPFPLYGGSLAIKDSYGAGIQAQAQYGTGTYPNGSSRLCMSCHDGVTAIGVGLLRDGSDIAMVGSAGHELDPDGSLFDSLSTVIDLATSHPISFVYSDTVAGLIEAAYDAQFGAGSYFQGPSAFDPAVSSPLDRQERMQCTTCHNPHYDTRLSDPLRPPFWQNTFGSNATEEYQNVCNQCHLGTPAGVPPLHDLP